MPADGADQPGVLATLRRLGDHALRLLENRCALLSLEAQEEKWRLVDLALRVVLVAVLALGALGVLTALLVELLPLPVWGTLALLFLVYAGGAAAGVAGLRRRLREDPPPFQRTADEFRKDREWLRRKN
jgi:uncharacterized membrane protein YqjE